MFLIIAEDRRLQLFVARLSLYHPVVITSVGDAQGPLHRVPLTSFSLAELCVHRKLLHGVV